MSFEQVMRFAFLYTDVECRMQKLMASGMHLCINSDRKGSEFQGEDCGYGKYW